MFTFVKPLVDSVHMETAGLKNKQKKSKTNKTHMTNLADANKYKCVLLQRYTAGIFWHILSLMVVWYRRQLALFFPARSYTGRSWPTWQSPHMQPSLHKSAGVFPPPVLIGWHPHPPSFHLFMQSPSHQNTAPQQLKQNITDQLQKKRKLALEIILEKKIGFGEFV